MRNFQTIYKNLLFPKKELSLEQSIFNEILIILSVTSIFAGIQNSFLNLPFWLSAIFFLGSAISISFLIYANYTKDFKSVKILFIVLLYLITIAGWFYNGGLNGTIVLFLIFIIIYTIGICNKISLRLFLFNFATFASLVLVNYYYPNTLMNTYKDETEHVTDMIFTYFAGGLSIVLVFRTILSNYNKTHKLVLFQKQELQMLHADAINRNILLDSKNADLEKQNEVINKQSKKLNELIESREKMYSVIAHDLRNPLSSIMGLTDILNKNISKLHIDEYKKFIEAISHTSKNASLLLDNLLEWTKIQTKQLDETSENLSLKETIQEVVEQVNLSAQLKNITISVYQVGNESIFTTKYMLQIILRNIISNAIKFTNEDGKIDIYVTTILESIEITIKDNGVGMDERTISNIFETNTRIYTTGTNKEVGSGLGLLLSKEFIEKLNGNLVVKSEPGIGSEFKIILPSQ